MYRTFISNVAKSAFFTARTISGHTNRQEANILQEKIIKIGQIAQAQGRAPTHISTYVCRRFSATTPPALLIIFSSSSLSRVSQAAK